MVAGAIDAYEVLRPVPYCLPSKASLKELSDAAAAYIELHPEKGQRPASDVIFEAMQANFPCGRASR